MGLPNEIVAGLIGGKKQYQIERSLRFNSVDSAYLSRTPGSAGNQQTWTISFWLKRCSITSNCHIFAAGTSPTNYMQCSFSSSFTANDDKFRLGFVSSNVAQAILVSSALYRDPSSWYHFVIAIDTTQATASDRIRVWSNGIQITSWDTATYPSLNANLVFWNTTTLQVIGSQQAHTTKYYSDQYLAEIHFIDGTALTPSSFGETDISTGTWIPKKYTGTYGTNGFYLPFSDNTSTTTLGDDSSGNNNDWTLNNFSVTAGAGNDSLEDTPTNNWAVLSSVDKVAAGTLLNGNLAHHCSTSTFQTVRSSIAMPTGLWYAEATVGGDWLGTFGIGLTTLSIPSFDSAFNGSYVILNNAAGTRVTRSNGVGTNSRTADAANDVWQCAYNADTGNLWLGRNNTWFGGGDPAAGTSPTYTVAAGLYAFIASGGNGSGQPMNLNFGQRPFAYTPPTGFKALNTKNLPTPSIKNPSKYMNVTTWTGNGNTRSITGIGFQPDLVWTKSRSNAEDHKLVDSSRTAGRALESNTTDDEVIESGISSFDSDGFTIDGATDAGYNTNTYTYVGWTWKKGIVPGFDIVPYTGNGTARTIPHSLGIAPHFMIVKARTTAGTNQGWPVYHRNNTAAPETDYLLLNSANATADLDTIWNDTAPTSSVFSVGTNALVNTNNDTYVAYLFAEVEGFSKFGSYTGNGSADGPFVYCGFRPKFTLIKISSGAADHWNMVDATRNSTNPTTFDILASKIDTEYNFTSAAQDFLANGFKLRNSNQLINLSGATYIFAAFAEHPFKYSRAR